MCNPCLSTSEISGASDTSLMENVEGRNEGTYSTFHNKKPCEGGEAGEITNFTSITSSNRESFGLLNNEVKRNEPGLILNKLRSENSDRLIIGHLNINFISLVKDKLDIIMVPETKIDESLTLYH